MAFVNGTLRGYEVRDGANRMLAKDGMRVAELNELHGANAVDCRVVWTGG